MFNLLPKYIKEQVKLIYYNKKIRKYSFSYSNGIYSTSAGDLQLIKTETPLYFIIKDIERYERYHQISKEDIVVDAGANEGILTLVYSSKARKGQVYSFEPDSKNVNVFQRNLELNEKHDNVELINKALWSESRSIKFFEAGTVGSSSFYKDEKSVFKMIPALSLDDFINDRKLEKLDFIKMDIEGAEIKALQGSINTIKRLKPDIAIATYHIIDSVATYKKVEEIFLMLDYPFKTVFYEDGEIITYAGNLKERQ